jgi:hypothetical protein
MRRYENNLAKQLSGAAPATSRRPSLLSIIYHQAAAIIVLGLLVSIALIFRQGIPQAKDRGVPESLLTLVHPAARSALLIPFYFRWKDKISAREYVVELFDDSLKPLWKSNRIAKTTIPLPHENIGILVPGRIYFWMVTAYSAGMGVTESELQEFSIVIRR